MSQQANKSGHWQCSQTY